MKLVCSGERPYYLLEAGVSPAPAGSLSPLLARSGPNRYIITLEGILAGITEYYYRTMIVTWLNTSI